MRPLVCLAAVAVSAAAPASAASVSVWAGSSGAPGTVRVYDALDGSWFVPPGLAGIELLPLSASGRTAVDEQREDRARVHVDVAPATRVRLPAGAGSLYQFRRVDAEVVVHGLMLVDPQGVARSLFERPAAGGVGPFVPSVACAPNGALVAIATTVDAGGDVWQLDLATGTATNRTASLPPLVLGPNSIALGSSLALAVSPSGAWRFDPLAPGDAQPVPIEGEAFTWFRAEAVASPSSTAFAFVGGSGPQLAEVLVARASGPALSTGAPRSTVEPAGFVPDAANGPWIAVADDGATCAWRSSDGHGYSRELFLARTAATASTASTQHVTRDELFEPYLDEVGTLVFVPGGALLFGAGDPGLLGSTIYGRMDLFRAQLDGSGLALANLSGTSGDPTPPFVAYPTLDPARIVWHAPQQRFLVHEPEGVSGRLLQVTAQAGAGLGVISEELTTLDLLETLGDEVLLALEDGEEEQGLERVESGEGETEELYEYSSTTAFSRGVAGPDGWYAFVLREGATEFVGEVHAATGVVRILTSRPLVYGTSFGFASDRTLFVSVGVPGGPSIFLAWPAQGPVRRLSAQPITGFVLPGR